MAITLPSIYAKLPDALINSGHITYLKSDPGSHKNAKVSQEPAGAAQFSSPNKIKQLASKAEQAVCKGRFTDLTDQLALGDAIKPNTDIYEGKTVIENESKPAEIIVGSLYTEDGKLIFGPGYGESRARSGAPDHAFFYHDTEFLTDAAKEYATLDENEVFRNRHISDLNFVQNTLDFFTNGNYTGDDVRAMQKQMTDVVFELSRQIKKGENPDFSQLQSKVTIGGADVSFSQLLEFQELGSELRNSFDNICVGELDVQNYAQMGIAKAIGNYYGSDKGAIGAMFSSAMNRLYEKGVAKTENLIKWVSSGNSGYHRSLTERGRDAVQTAVNIRDIFSKLDTSSKENLSKDFSEKLSAVRTMVQNHCNRFNIPTSYVSLDSDTAGIVNYFNTQLNQL